jgi:hypothetical protein
MTRRVFTNGMGYTEAQIPDRLSHTLAFAEVMPCHGPEYWGPPGDGMVAEGGQAFGYLTPKATGATREIPRDILPPAYANGVAVEIAGNRSDLNFDLKSVGSTQVFIYSKNVMR